VLPNAELSGPTAVALQGVIRWKKKRDAVLS
jgi:hypothetical protein